LHHEDPFEEGESRLLLCVQAADTITRKLGYSLKPDSEVSLLQDPALGALGLGDVELAALMVDLEDELAEVKRLF
jgi:hypothetical protein